jgi:phage replication O-like protein O
MRTTRTVSYIPYSFVPNHTATIEALARSRLSGRQIRTVLFIMRQTDGYLRDEDRISPGFFARKTGIGKDHMPHVLRRLEALNIIAVTQGHPPTYSVNPPDSWRPAAFAKNGEPPSPKMATTHAKFGENPFSTTENRKTTMARNRYRENRPTRNDDPDKYIRGRYGHLVRR